MTEWGRTHPSVRVERKTVKRKTITAEQLHRCAMRLADLADLGHRHKRTEAAARFFAQAAILELVAARATDWPRTRLIYFKSAAWLAYKAGRIGQAEQIAYEGLREPRLEAWARRELPEVIAAVAKARGERPPLICLPGGSE